MTIKHDQIRLNYIQIIEEAIEQESTISAVAHTLVSKDFSPVITTGIGKSAIMAERFAASLRSIGIGAYFLHLSEFSHGDLGALRDRHPLLIGFSNSGETRELCELLRVSRQQIGRFILLTGNKKSSLSNLAEHIVFASRGREFDFGGFLPTFSLTQTSVLCDLILIKVCEIMKFSASKFLLNHKSGALGDMLVKSVGEVMAPRSKCAIVSTNHNLEHVAIELTKKGHGLAAVCDDNFRLQGIITDGDIRRGLMSDFNAKEILAGNFCTKSPISVTPFSNCAEAIDLMHYGDEKLVGALPVVENGYLLGIITLKQIMMLQNVSQI